MASRMLDWEALGGGYSGLPDAGFKGKTAAVLTAPSITESSRLILVFEDINSVKAVPRNTCFVLPHENEQSLFSLSDCGI